MIFAGKFATLLNYDANKVRGIPAMVKILDYINRMPKPVLLVFGCLIIILLGFIDYQTGFEISFSIFYLPCIILIAWSAGRWTAFFISLLSSATWMTADLISGHAYSNIFIPIWNTTMRFLVFITVSYLVSLNRKYLETEKKLAITDALTEAANSRFFCTQVKKELERAKRSNQPVTLVYFDIDNFKRVNDTLGHNTGDRLLRTMAGIVKRMIRSIDIFARLGGDEFALLLFNSGQDQSKIVVQKIKEALLNLAEANGWPVTFSFGVVTCLNIDKDVEELVKTADDLMYKVKKQGKNGIQYLVF
ncbi:MAG: GGDEF domain-containing protein [Spirochaetales bacterium]|nr:GGDEF domain-containing protein [Spirochaetales bacterium]